MGGRQGRLDEFGAKYGKGRGFMEKLLRTSFVDGFLFEPEFISHLSQNEVAEGVRRRFTHRVRIKRDVSCSWIFVHSESAKKGNYM